MLHVSPQGKLGSLVLMESNTIYGQVLSVGHLDFKKESGQI